MYFKYGIKNSILEVQEDAGVELTVARSSSSDSGTGIKTTNLANLNPEW